MPHLKHVVDSSSAVQDAQNLTGLATGVKCEGEVEKVIEGKL